MKISQEELRHLQQLSAFDMSEEKLQTLAENFNKIASLIEKIKEVEVEDTFVQENILEIKDLRMDQKIDSMPREEVLQNAPDKNEASFLVPKVVE